MSQRDAVRPPARSSRWPDGLVRGWAVLVGALAPALLAVALTPGFTTQDGPAHVHSARILNRALAGCLHADATFRVAWEPVPNWAGHLLTMLAVAAWSPEVANRVVTIATALALGSSLVVLRVAVAGRRGVEVAAVVAALLALNVTWLLGFTSFLLGAALMPLTLAYWWRRRGSPSVPWAVGLAALLVGGYFCHPISLGLTLATLGILTLATPGPMRDRRLALTALGGLPLVPLGWAYRGLTRSGGALEPVWAHWSPSWSGVVGQLGWVDPLSLAAKSTVPFELGRGRALAVAATPIWWTLAGLGVLAALTWRGWGDERRGWLVAAAVLVAAGVIAPDTLGARHGHFLPQRLVLLGLLALVPWLDGGLERRAGRVGLGFLGLALASQSLFVWDYARTSRERLAPFLAVAEGFGPRDRVGTLLNGIRGRFRANPLLHADGLIAARTDAVFWTNYETAQYYFPVRVRDEVPHPVATRFEEIAILDEPGDAARRLALWDGLLGDHGDRIDRIVEWQADPRLDARTARDYEVTARVGPIRLWRRRSPPEELPSPGGWSPMPESRTLRFAGIGEVMPEVDRLLRRGYEPAGRWSLGQVCGHLSGAVVASIEGMPFRAPWAVRALIGGLAKRSVLGSGRMPRRVKLPERFAPRPDLDDRAEAEALRAALGVLGRHAGPMSIHPLFGPMTRDDWVRFHAIHAAHHLGFLVPTPGGAENRPH